MKLLFALLLVSQLLSAQKLAQKKLINSATTAVQIDLSNCYELQLETSDTNEMIVEARIEGEYEKDLALRIVEEGSTLLVGVGFRPNFVNPNDKLSAHKVVSIALKISLPKDKNVIVFGSSSNVAVRGNYETLKVTLNDGSCTMYNVQGQVYVVTQSGTINASAKAAVILSNSKYGSIEKQFIPKGNSQYNFSTVTGNIQLYRIE